MGDWGGVVKGEGTRHEARGGGRKWEKAVFGGLDRIILVAKPCLSD